MPDPKDADARQKKLNGVVSGLEEVLETLHDDARAYAAIASAIAFVEVVLGRRLGPRLGDTGPARPGAP